MNIFKSRTRVLGRLGNYSAYRIKGSDQIFVRRKGGATKEKIKNDPAFETTRRLNAEFSGRALCYRNIMRSLFQLKPIADYKTGGRCNKLIKVIQDRDTDSVYGQQNIYLSRYPRLLEGFSLNTKFQFDSMLTTPLKFLLSREDRTAEVILPQVIPGINFHAANQYSHCRFILVLAIIPDMHSAENGYRPAYDLYEGMTSAGHYSEWYAAPSGSPEETVSLTVSAAPPDDQHALVFAAGIQFGSAIVGAAVNPVKYGSARITETSGLPVGRAACWEVETI